MKYLKIILIVLLFSFLLNNLNVNNANADLVPREPYPIKPLIPNGSYPRYVHVEPGLYFPNGIKSHKNNQQAANPNTRACGVEIFVQGPCDYSYILYDEKDNIIFKEEGSTDHIAHIMIKSKKTFQLPKLKIKQTVKYKIKATMTLYNYEVREDKDRKDPKNKYIKNMLESMLHQRHIPKEDNIVINDNDVFNYKYKLINKNGPKLEKERIMTIIRESDGNYIIDYSIH